MSRTRLSYIYAGIAILFWSTIPTAFKICLGEMPIIHMLSIASFTSALALLGIIIAGKKTSLLISSSPSGLLSSAILGLMNPFVYYLILLKAYKLLPAQVAQPLNMIWHIILVFLSAQILKQKIATRSYAALLISFLGVYIISSRGKLFSHNSADTLGVLLATGSSVFWALYFILNMRYKRDESVKLFLNFIFGSLYLAIAMTVTGNWPGMGIISLKGWVSAVYIGLFEMGLTFFFWLKALQLAPSTDKVSNLVYLAPFLSLVFVNFILHEPLYLTTPLGLLLIITGILIQNKNKRKRA